MTTVRQICANRRNALRSTGPTTEEGKQRSRRNAVRHGLTAETVIEDLEDAEDYKAFELTVASGFDAPTAVERELVLRLASLLWRLRRATAIETGLLQLQHDIIASLKDERQNAPPNKLSPAGNGRVDGLPPDIQCVNNRSATISYIEGADAEGAARTSINTNTDIACCFLRLANLDNGAFERANRYETALWRQVGQILLTLDFLRRNS
jgi:hypothetical protein